MELNFERIQQKEQHANLFNLGLLHEKVDFLIKELSSIGNKLGQVDQKPAQEENDVIQVKEAAKLIGRSESTVYIKASKKELFCWNDGDRLWFSRKDLTAWLLANKGQDKIENPKSKMKSLRTKYAKK